MSPFRRDSAMRATLTKFACSSANRDCETFCSKSISYYFVGTLMHEITAKNHNPFVRRLTVRLLTTDEKQHFCEQNILYTYFYTKLDYRRNVLSTFVIAYFEAVLTFVHNFITRDKTTI